TAGSRKLYEACLSLPGRMFVVERPKLVKFHFTTLGGEERTWKVHDQLAQAVMHEMEHLRGILVVDVAITEVKDFDPQR
ncbi:peptide deformylase, partial [Patescibacteria group bacterium]|nr:peptide deformylase [Patescibacteria group bacterium]